MTQKRMTRKELRQPDEFVAFSQRAWTYLGENRWAVIVGSSVTALVIVAVSLWVAVAQSRAAEATLKLGKALETYNQMVHEPEDVKQFTDALGAATDEQPRFESIEEKLAHAAEKFSALHERRGRSGAGGLALLLHASTAFDQGDYEKAATDAEAFLKSAKQPQLRQLAIELVGYAYEGLAQWDQANNAFDRLSAEDASGNGPFTARYHKARILAKQERFEEAATALRQLIDDAKSGNGSPDLIERAEQQLALLAHK